MIYEFCNQSENTHFLSNLCSLLNIYIISYSYFWNWGFIRIYKLFSIIFLRDFLNFVLTYYSHWFFKRLRLHVLKNIEFKFVMLYHHLHISVVIVSAISFPLFNWLQSHRACNMPRMEFSCRSLTNATFPIFIWILSRCCTVSISFHLKMSLLWFSCQGKQVFCW